MQDFLRKNALCQPLGAQSGFFNLSVEVRFNVMHDKGFFLKQGAVLKQVYVWKPASALSLPLSSHSRADTAITPAVFLLSVLMYSRGSPEARLFIPPGFGPAGLVLIGEINYHEICVCCIRCLVCFYVILCLRTEGNNGLLLN